MNDLTQYERKAIYLEEKARMEEEEGIRVSAVGNSSGSIKDAYAKFDAPEMSSEEAAASQRSRNLIALYIAGFIALAILAGLALRGGVSDISTPVATEHSFNYNVPDSPDSDGSAPIVKSPVDIQVDLLLAKCDPSITSDQLLRVAQKCSDIMAQRGVSESPLSILTHVNESIPDGANLGTHPQDVFAAYATLRLDGNK